MAFMLEADKRLYAQVTHPYSGLFPNSSGSSTIAGGDIVPLISLEDNTEAGLIDSEARTVGLARTRGLAGRKRTTWRGTFPWQPSGSAGVVPNLDQMLQALVCQAGSVSAGVSVAYTPSASANPSQLSLFSFRTPGSNVFQSAIRGALVDDFEIGSSEGEAQCTFGGPCSGVIDSVNFASYDSEDKGGLTDFPAEPGSPTTSGGSVVGFLGSGVSLDGVTTHTIRSWTFTFRGNRGLQYAFNNRNPTVPTARLRNISFSIDVFEENTVALGALRFKPYNSTPIPIILKLGVGAGNIMTINMPNAVIASENRSNSEGQSVLTFAGSAFATSASANDEFSIVLT
jgi:hypothetical protein